MICGIVGLKRAKQGLGGRALALAGLALSGLWVLIVVVMVGYYLIINDAKLFGAEPTTGDCVAEVPQGDESVSVSNIDCADLHEGEVVAVLAMPDGGFPGQDALAEYRRRCESELITYSPGAAQDPTIGLYVRYPTQSLWERGYRDVTCVATSDPPRTGSIKGWTGERSVASYFRTGDCFAELPTGAKEVTLVDCAEPHAAEVFAVFMLANGDFPGEAVLSEYRDRCDRQFAVYSPSGAQDPSVRVLKRYPDQAAWDLGDRSVTCIAASDPPRTGSLRG